MTQPIWLNDFVPQVTSSYSPKCYCSNFPDSALVLVFENTIVLASKSGVTLYYCYIISYRDYLYYNYCYTYYIYQKQAYFYYKWIVIHINFLLYLLLFSILTI